MALTLKTAATLRKLRSNPNLLQPQQRQEFAQPKEADTQLSEAIDSFFPQLDQSESDGAPEKQGVLRYHTSRGERIQVTYNGDSSSGEYVQEWVGGGFLYTRFSEDSVENYQVGPKGANHLHIDRKDPSNTYLEVSPQGYDPLATESAPPAPPQVSTESLVAKDGLQYAVLQEGDPSEKADKGESLLLHYTGWLENGESFDSSLGRKKPFSFQLGAGKVIQGWERGVEGMAVGEKRLLQIPSSLAYGERSVGSIPPNSPLTFEVELLATSGELTRP